MIVKKLTLMAMLTAIALVVFVIEAQIPVPVPVPGAKLGLANSVTLFALFYIFPPSQVAGSRYPQPDSKRSPALTVSNVLMILVCRIILGAMFTGRVVSFIYSLVGGLLSFSAMAAAKKVVTEKQVWACGALGAVFHNVGQIIAAMFITGAPSIIAYLPVLIIIGILTGVVTGLAAQFTVARLSKL